MIVKIEFSENLKEIAEEIMDLMHLRGLHPAEMYATIFSLQEIMKKQLEDDGVKFTSHIQEVISETN